ncbi:hypothetical protein AGMMS49921_14020 [Endomicrobiia bacterium]|nr:hypothetical protein AGMMS49921_14020 [Endomicrobiia bacterium]
MSSLEEAVAQKRHESSYSYARSFTKRFLARKRKAVIANPDRRLIGAKKMFPKITTKI